MRGALGVVAGLACAAVIACSATPRPASTMPAAAPPQPATPRAAEPVPSDPHAAIEYYAEQIDAQRKQLQLPEAVLPMSTQPTAAIPRAAEDTTCHPAASATCGDVCRMSDSICDNSEKICKLADDLGDDPWAAGKCTSARQTCGDAHKRCCECT
jgi:glucose/arabinose dehydrogenase